MDSSIRLSRGNRAIRYRVAGDRNAPAVILTHGAGLDHRVFAPQVEPLAERYFVIRWDLPGHGESKPIAPGISIRGMAEDLVAVLDHAGVDRAAMVGHSMGADVVQETVFRHPARARALIVVSSVRLFDRRGLIARFFALVALWKLRLLPADRFREAMASASTADPAVRRYILECLGRLSRSDLAGVWSAIGRGPHVEPTYRFPCPLLVLVGARDRIGGGFISGAARPWVELEREARLESIPGAGHVPTLERPAETNAALLGFLDRFAR